MYQACALRLSKQPCSAATVAVNCGVQANKVSCVGVISHSQGGGLAASLSSSDLCGLLPEHFVALGAPVLQYLTAKASPGWAMQQHALVKPCKPQLPPIHGMKPILRQPAQDKDEQQDQEQQQQLQQPEMPQHSLGSAQAWGLKVSIFRQILGPTSCCPTADCRPHDTWPVLQFVLPHSLMEVSRRWLS